MNIKALITTLAILGSSSVALARPATATSVNASLKASVGASFNFGTVRPTVRDHRAPAPVVVRPVTQRYETGYDASWDRARYQPRALILEQGLQFATHEYRKDIVFTGSERFNTLKLDSDGGQTYIMKVVIEFKDGGTYQQIDVNRTLRGSQGLSIDLSGTSRQLHRILVYRADGGEALNMNRQHNGGFTVSAL